MAESIAPVMLDCPNPDLAGETSLSTMRSHGAKDITWTGKRTGTSRIGDTCCFCQLLEGAWTATLRREDGEP